MISRILEILCIFALTVHASVPPGFMLAPGDSTGLLSVVICTSDGHKIVLVNAAGEPVEQQEPQQPEAKLCDYATSVTSIPAEIPSQLATQVRFASIVYRIQRELFRASPKPRARFARAPPWLTGIAA